MDEVSFKLCEYLQNALYPKYIHSKEDVCLTAPYESDQDYRIGIMMYDMSGMPFLQHHYKDEGQNIRYPPQSVELFYVIYLNQKHHFGGQNQLLKQELLTRILMIIEEQPQLTVHDYDALMTLENLSLDDKIRLWQSLSSPFQFSLYIKVSPVFIPSTRVKEAHRVQEIDYQYTRKEE